MRDLLLMPAASKKVLTGPVDVRRKEAPLVKCSNALERGDKTAAAAGPSSGSSVPAACPSPLNLSAESGIDNAERSSSVDSALSKVRPVCAFLVIITTLM